MLGVLKADDKSIQQIRPMMLSGGGTQQQAFSPLDLQSAAIMAPINGRAAEAKSISPGVRMSKDSSAGMEGGAAGDIGSMVDELSDRFGQNPLDFDTADLLENPGKNIHEIILLGLGAAALFYFARGR